MFFDSSIDLRSIKPRLNGDNAGTVGTKGGACTDVNGRVLDLHGKPVAGLWAAGNAMASIIGPGTIAPGLTLGLALTWGYIAGKDAAQDALPGG